MNIEGLNTGSTIYNEDGTPMKGEDLNIPETLYREKEIDGFGVGGLHILDHRFSDENTSDVVTFTHIPDQITKTYYLEGFMLLIVLIWIAIFFKRRADKINHKEKMDEMIKESASLDDEISKLDKTIKKLRGA